MIGLHSSAHPPNAEQIPLSGHKPWTCTQPYEGACGTTMHSQVPAPLAVHAHQPPREASEHVPHNSLQSCLQSGQLARPHLVSTDPRAAHAANMGKVIGSPHTDRCPTLPPNIAAGGTKTCCIAPHRTQLARSHRGETDICSDIALPKCPLPPALSLPGLHALGTALRNRPNTKVQTVKFKRLNRPQRISPSSVAAQHKCQQG